MGATRNRDLGAPGHPTQFASPLNSAPEASIALPAVDPQLVRAARHELHGHQEGTHVLEAMTEGSQQELLQAQARAGAWREEAMETGGAPAAELDEFTAAQVGAVVASADLPHAADEVQLTRLRGFVHEYVAREGWVAARGDAAEARRVLASLARQNLVLPSASGSVER